MDVAQRTQHRTDAADRTKTILGEPFRAATWKRVVYQLTALPLGLLCIPLALLGGPAGRIQRAVARGLLGLEVDEPERTGPLALVHAVLSAPLNLITAALTVYGWWLVPLNLAYPLRADADASSAWGGPTLAGAWALHAVCGGVAFLLLMPWLGRGLTALQGRLVASLLGGRRTGAPKAIGLALLTAAFGALIAIPVIHQL
jgi:hypothetical protein